MRRTLWPRTRLIPLAAVLGCVYVPPAPPTYAPDTCEPSDRTYLDLATRTRDVLWSKEIPEDPEAARDYCRKVANDRGWRFTTKLAPPTNFWGRSATTGSNELLIIPLPQDFERRSVEAQAGTVCHEVVHTFQWERDTTRVMAPTYLINEGTWVYEVPAYVVSLRLWLRYNPGADAGDVEAQARRYTNRLWSSYDLANNMPECMKDTTVAILVDGLNL